MCSVFDLGPAFLGGLIVGAAIVAVIACWSLHVTLGPPPTPRE